MTSDQDPSTLALSQAWQALRKGERLQARYWAEQAAAQAPEEEDAWLILAAVASPRASLAYLEKALEINPGSVRARKGMHWAIQRLRAAPPAAPISPPVAETSASTSKPRLQLPLPTTAQAYTLHRPAFFIWAIIILCLATGLFAGLRLPIFLEQTGRNPLYSLAQVQPAKATLTETPIATATFTPTATPTTTPTFTPTPTPLPSDTPPPTAPQAAAPQKPKKTPKPQNVTGPGLAPGFADQADLWIDVDLSSQTAYAMQGNQVLRSFIVSTGTWQHPTVTGIFRVYVKYRYADMSGPGYYLPNVPFVMYFYKDYGLHGTYWHKNFGTPMSHGCVNFRTEDAQWLYKNSSVGTLVQVHY
jgi:lipoprotein-anchoring transpeptidase ErfK/SrfK